ncbi:COG1361 family protein [Aeoliella mucimassa]|uniref:DUF11 domain-containing protein n=1 Tax=Aeoliella mucimassa TaxID=2527972 RepID=A0A518ASM5_9BACT|nr:DUF11 domain-containing protein [Aeoliella mucimassa]QDU57720.1 hypothetical protein Pan181_39420 [Aeoliella mucimassa]
MNRLASSTRTLTLVAIVATIATAGGCALSGMPRIDPTGQRLLIWPNEPTPTLSATAPAAAPTLVPGTTAALPTTPGNTTTAPVYTDPYLPGAGTSTTDWLGRPVVVGPAVASSTGQPIAGIPQQVAYPPGEAVRITPSRILAPVGSEVILVAGVCAENGYLRTNERIEWMLDRAGTGQIVTVGGRGELDMFRLPQNTPRKVDNYFAIGATSPFNECLDRGTPDPNDDVQIRRGDAWATITSPAEGTTYVTAYAPNVPNWQGRTARSTIYWIDAQWSFPASVTLAPGETHTLTTTVTRQSDGAPIKGWIVRYKVAGGSAGLGYGDGPISDETTDDQGRASVRISPTDARGGTTNVQIEIVRPEQAGYAASPRVTLAQGAATISWADGGIAGSPNPSLPTTPPPALEPTPDSSGGSDSGGLDWNNTPIPPAPPLDNTPSGPASPSETGTPDLAVDIQQLTPDPLKVGDVVRYQITVSNQGNGTARNVKLRDDFDLGLVSDVVATGQQYIESDPLQVVNLDPQQTWQPPALEFRITRAGSLSHSVTVSAQNAVSRTQRALLNAVAEAEPVEPQLNVTIVGPPRKDVGQTAEFRLTIENTGTVAATNVVAIVELDAELKPLKATEPFDSIYYEQTGQIRWTFARIEPGQRFQQDVLCDCQASSMSSCARGVVQAAGLAQAITQSQCVEIRQPLGGGGISPPPTTIPDNTTQPPPSNPNSGGLGVGVRFSVTQPRVQQRVLITVTVQNNDTVAKQGLSLHFLVPKVVQPDLTLIQPQQLVQRGTLGNLGQELTVGPMPDIAPGGTVSVMIPVDAVSPGRGEFYVSTILPGSPEVPYNCPIDVQPR